jgi:membrane protease YdiL (CAAX protease family)
MSNRQLWTFLVLSFLFAVPPQLLAVAGDMDGPGARWLRVTMWAPAVAALLSGGEVRARALASLRRWPWRWVGAALLVGWSFTLVESGLQWGVGAAHWDGEHFPIAADGRGVEGIRKLGTVLGGHAQGWAPFALNLLLSITLGSLLVGAVGGLGEELGWRAVLQPELERRFGPVKGGVLVGLLWGYWHLPVNLAGYNDATHPWLTALVFFQVFTVGMALALGWLTRKAGGSVWPAAVAHGANNTLASAFVVKPDGWAADTYGQLVAAVLVGAFFAWRMVRAERARRAQAQSAFPVAAGA